MPALVNSSVGSFAGTSDDERTILWPRPSKKFKNRLRISVNFIINYKLRITNYQKNASIQLLSFVRRMIAVMTFSSSFDSLMSGVTRLDETSPDFSSRLSQ